MRLFHSQCKGSLGTAELRDETSQGTDDDQPHESPETISVGVPSRSGRESLDRKGARHDARDP